MAKSKIDWTDEVWNPVVGCRRVSPGCSRCYAEVMARRLEAMGRPEYSGLTVVGVNGRPRWQGQARFLSERLDQPLRWKKPRQVFVNSMSDLFHEDVTFEQIAEVFGIMATAERHVFQVLTKRPRRMLVWFKWLQTWRPHPVSIASCVSALQDAAGHMEPEMSATWPLPNIHLGVSVEDHGVTERLAVLAQVPAMVRWASIEPLIGAVRLRDVIEPGQLDWVVVGGESGHGARPCRLEWIRKVVEDCRELGIPVFVKQLGARPMVTQHLPMAIRDKKGADPSEWPEDLRVREYPGERP